MALVLLAGVAYATYRTRQQRSSELLALDLQDKTAVTLLPVEQTLGLLESPISTITYLKGDYQQAAAHLRQRVDEILHVNPWVGGWVAKEGQNVHLWYDEQAQSFAPGIFRVFAPGQVPLRSDTPYEKYQEIAQDYLEATQDDSDKCKVPPTMELVGQNRAAWRVSVIPYQDDDAQFVVVVSMSRVLGDPRTFYQLYGMLSLGINDDHQVYALNPHRHLESDQILTEHFGKEELHYIRDMTQTPKWSWTRKPLAKVDDDPTKILIFTIPPNLKDSDNLDFVSLLSAWFFQTLQPTVGMMAFDIRDKIPDCNVTEKDAGNYVVTIPLTEVDYHTPGLIRQALEKHKRCGSEPPAALPRDKTDTTNFAFCNDWSQHTTNSINLGEDIHETLHLPLYDARDLTMVPNSLSCFLTFRAGETNEKLGAMVVAPTSACQAIESSGMVGEMIANF